MAQKQALIVEDNPQNMRVLTQLLSKQGVNSIEVRDPRTLTQQLTALPRVDLIFLDLEMPGLDGFSVKDMLRAHFGAIPIIACTVHVSEMQQTREHGFDGFLGKPLIGARFPEQLARILRGEPVWERA